MISALTRLLVGNHTLVTLYFRNNALGDEYTIALTECLPRSRLHTLDLAKNELGSASIQQISFSLEHGWHSAKVLLLDQNPLKENGAMLLAEGLRRSSTSLRQLDLDESELGDAGAAEILLATRDATSLEKLSLKKNQLSALAADAIELILSPLPSSSREEQQQQHNCCWQGNDDIAARHPQQKGWLELDFSANLLGAENVIRILRAATIHPTLKIMNVRNNAWTGKAATPQVVDQLERFEVSRKAATMTSTTAAVSVVAAYNVYGAGGTASPPLSIFDRHRQNLP